jgi:hypothetical protein
MATMEEFFTLIVVFWIIYERVWEGISTLYDANMKPNLGGEILKTTPKRRKQLLIVIGAFVIGGFFSGGDYGFFDTVGIDTTTSWLSFLDYVVTGICFAGGSDTAHKVIKSLKEMAGTEKKN